MNPEPDSRGKQGGGKGETAPHSYPPSPPLYRVLGTTALPPPPLESRERNKSCCLAGVHCVPARSLSHQWAFSALPPPPHGHGSEQSPPLPFTRRSRKTEREGGAEQAQETSTHTSSSSFPSSLYYCRLGPVSSRFLSLPSTIRRLSWFL